MDSNLSLAAWRPWRECLAAYRYLSCLESPGAFPHWRIYWAGTLTLLKTTRDVLDRVDRKKSSLHSQIIHDFLKVLAQRRGLNRIYWEFVCGERDSLVHEFAMRAQEQSVTTRPFLVDTDLTYCELVEKYGERSVIVWGEDEEDGLYLLKRALQWWEHNLRIIEAALKSSDRSPFSSAWQRRGELLEESLRHIEYFNYDWERGSVPPPTIPQQA